MPIELVVWLIGGVILFLAGLALMAWEDGKGELGTGDRDNIVMGIVMLAILWPVVVTFALIGAPFLGFYYLIKTISAKRG